MAKLDRKMVRKSFRKVAMASGGTFAEVVKNFDDNLAEGMPSKECFNLTDVLASDTLDAEDTAHLKNCRYCRRFLKLLVIFSVPKSELAKIIEKAAEYLKVNPEDLAEALANGSEGDKCFTMSETLLFPDVADPRRKHRKECDFCKYFQTVLACTDVPELD